MGHDDRHQQRLSRRLTAIAARVQRDERVGELGNSVPCDEAGSSISHLMHLTEFTILTVGQTSALTYRTGVDADCRSMFQSKQKLDNTQDSGYRAIDEYGSSSFLLPN